MSILIKDMPMPKDGVYWCEIGVAGDIATLTIHGEDRKSFHLVPVPLHGRLIDLDYADNYAYDELELANSYLTGWEAARAMQKIYQNVPIIIPADEKEE